MDIVKNQSQSIALTNAEMLAILESGISSSNVMKIIDSTAYHRQQMLEKYRRYRADGLPIQSRTFKNEDKINHKINNDFYSEIVDTKVGYMVGKPVVYKSENESIQSKLSDFVKYNNLEDLDSQTIKMSSVCGLSYRLVYVDSEGELAVTNINPWEVIFIKDMYDIPKFAIRVVDLNLDSSIVTVYSKEGAVEYIVNGGTYSAGEIKANIFEGKLPVIEFLNNDECLGDCDKVIELIDAYDRALSDVNSEIEQFRLAYLMLKGFDMEDDDIEAMKKTGAFCVPDGGDAYFITKNLDDNILEHHFDRIEKNIMRFSNSVNFSDDAFGTASGIALKYKLQALDNKALKTERKFGVGLRSMFDVCGKYWSIAGTKSSFRDISWTFRRNIPVDLLDEAETTNKLKGYVSEETRISQLTFIDDVDKEMKAMEEEQLETLGE